MRLTFPLVQLARSFVMSLRFVETARRMGCSARTLTERGLGKRLVGEIGGTLEVMLCLVVGSEGRGSLAGADEKLARPSLDPGGIVCVRRSPGRRRGSARR